jgi:hypothetical protein
MSHAAVAVRNTTANTYALARQHSVFMIHIFGDFVPIAACTEVETDVNESR